MGTTTHKIKKSLELLKRTEQLALEYSPDDCMKHVVEGYDKEPYHAIADDIQGAMSSIMVSNKYQIEIKITAL
jgi:hypothetical protein